LLKKKRKKEGEEKIHVDILLNTAEGYGYFGFSLFEA
jgi:hypothetical protein